MRYALISTLLIVIGITGCTLPGQKVAIDSLKRGLQATDEIHEILRDKAWQNSLNNAAERIRSAVSTGNGDAAASALEDFSDDLADITWLDIQHERARALARVGLQYIWEQQGIVDLLLEDLKIAKQRANQDTSESE